MWLFIQFWPKPESSTWCFVELVNFHSFVLYILLQNPEDQPEFPVITRKYFIQFHYPEDKSTHAEIYQILQDDQFSMLSPSQTQDLLPEVRLLQNKNRLYCYQTFCFIHCKLRHDAETEKVIFSCEILQTYFTGAAFCPVVHIIA